MTCHIIISFISIIAFLISVIIELEDFGNIAAGITVVIISFSWLLAITYTIIERENEEKVERKELSIHSLLIQI